MNPYRYLFPLGILFAALGVLPWVLVSLGIASGYPVLSHARIMMLGFFMAFVSGFLMTAVPKMTQSKPATNGEVGIVAILLVLQTLLSLQDWTQASLLVGILQFVFLAFFLVPRFLTKRSNPPPSFIFVPFGLLSGLAGVVLFSFSEHLPASAMSYAKLLFYQAFLLNPIIGLGARLIPVLSRIPGALDPTQQSARTPLSYLPLVFVLNFSFVVEAFLSASAGNLLRFFILYYVLVREFHIFKAPSEFSWLGINLKVSAAALILPYALLPIWPSYSAHLLHLIFLSGFGLMTLMIGVRVTLAHGGYSLQLEKTSRTLPVILLLISVATVVRVLAPFIASQYWTVLNLALVLWLGAVVLWAWQFVPKMNSFKK